MPDPEFHMSPIPPTPPPPPPPQFQFACRRGQMRILFFLGKGGLFRMLSREDFSEKNLKGSIFKPISLNNGCFAEASQETKKGGGGYDFYVHVFQAFNSLTRKGDRVRITLRISGKGISRMVVKYVHIFRVREGKIRRYKRRTVGHHIMFPR